MRKINVVKLSFFTTFPMVKLMALFTNAETKNAVVDPNNTYQVPPNVLLRALLIISWLPSTYDSPQTPGIILAIKKIKHTENIYGNQTA